MTKRYRAILATAGFIAAMGIAGQQERLYGG